MRKNRPQLLRLDMFDAEQHPCKHILKNHFPAPCHECSKFQQNTPLSLHAPRTKTNSARHASCLNLLHNRVRIKSIIDSEIHPGK